MHRFLLDDGLRRGLDMSRVLIELPGPRISGVTLAVVEDMKKFLVREFGPDVNIANVLPHDIMETEALRVGMGVVGPAVSLGLVFCFPWRPSRPLR